MRNGFHFVGSPADWSAVGEAETGPGNVWVSNDTLNTVTQFVGAASPVVTPIVANLLYPYGSRAVNRP